jgi:hypothetical protein
VAILFLAIGLWQAAAVFMDRKRVGPQSNASQLDTPTGTAGGGSQDLRQGTTQSAGAPHSGVVVSAVTPVANVSEGASIGSEKAPGVAPQGPQQGKPRIKTSAEILVKSAWKYGRQADQTEGPDDCERAVLRGQGSGACTVHVAVEYQIPHLNLMNEFVYGEMGLVSKTKQRCPVLPRTA